MKDIEQKIMTEIYEEEILPLHKLLMLKAATRSSYYSSLCGNQAMFAVPLWKMTSDTPSCIINVGQSHLGEQNLDQSKLHCTVPTQYLPVAVTERTGAGKWK